MKDRYLDNGNAQILMTEDNIKMFNTVIPNPSDPSGTMLNQEYHIEPPVTGVRLFIEEFS